MNKMSKTETMSKEAFNELIDNLEIVKNLTEYGKSGIKYNVKRLQKDLQQEKEKNSKIQKYVRSNEWAEDYEKSSCRTKILRILEE